MGRKTLEAFVGLIPQYGLFAATYALAALLHSRHPIQVVITGAKDDGAAAALEKAAHTIYRYGKSVLRLTPDPLATTALPAALRETLPNMNPAVPQAFVCVETTCFPPVSDPDKLVALLGEAVIGARGAES